jgi:hypothetical protein
VHRETGLRHCLTDHDRIVVAAGDHLKDSPQIHAPMRCCADCVHSLPTILSFDKLRLKRGAIT